MVRYLTPVVINVRVVLGNIAYGNPASLGEPLGLWTGQALVTGDATGGSVTLIFITQNPTDTPTLNDQRREFCWFIDNVSIRATPADPGNVSCQVLSHFARSNVVLPIPFGTAVSRTVQGDGLDFIPTGPLLEPQTLRQPLFWDTQELADASGPTQNLIVLRAQLNVLANTYAFRAYGRYYDRQVLANRSFGRLIAPPPVAPFD